MLTRSLICCHQQAFIVWGGFPVRGFEHLRALCHLGSSLHEVSTGPFGSHRLHILNARMSSMVSQGPSLEQELLGGW